MDPISIGMMAISAIGSIAGGLQGMSQARQERQTAETNIEVTKVNALNEENDRRDRLLKTLSAQRAQAAAMGLDVTRSGSLTAIQRSDSETADREIGQIRLNRLIAVSGYRQQAGAASVNGPMALVSGLLSAAGSIGGGIQRYNTIGGSSVDKAGPKVN